MNLIPRTLMKKSFLTALAVVCISASTALGAFAQGKVSVRIQAENIVAADQITLGDIAEVSGGDTTAVERARHTSLGFSPRVGATREIQRTNILLALAAAGFNESDLTLDMPAKFLVKRAAQVLSQNMLREAVEKAVLPQFEAEKLSARITKLELPDSLALPVGDVEIRVVNYSGITNFLTPTIISLEVKINGKVLRRVPADLTVEAFADVLVLNHNAVAGAKLTDADVRTENLKLERSVSSYLRTTAELAGKKLLKNLSQSSPLTTDAIASDIVIKSGDSVSIVARSGTMQIAINGEARASGRIGDRIAVKNTQSGVILQAQVVDEGTVKLNY